MSDHRRRKRYGAKQKNTEANFQRSRGQKNKKGDIKGTYYELEVNHPSANRKIVGLILTGTHILFSLKT